MLKVILEQLELKDRQVLPVQKDQKVRQDKVDQKEILVPPVQQVLKVTPVDPVQQVPQVLKEIRGIQVTLVQKVTQEHPVQQAVQDQ